MDSLGSRHGEQPPQLELPSYGTYGGSVELFQHQARKAFIPLFEDCALNLQARHSGEKETSSPEDEDISEHT